MNQVSLFVMALKAFAVFVFVGLSGLAVATLLVSREAGPIPAEVSGSPTPPEHSGRNVGNVLDGGDFVTLAPDGEAYVLIQYGAPEAFKQLIHTYRSEVWPQYRISTAGLQVGDDGKSWTFVAEASEQNGELVFDLRKVGAHKFWKITVVRSGDAPEVIFGRIAFVKDVGFIRSAPVDLVWLGLVPALLLLLICFRIPLSLGRVFLITAFPVALFLLFFSLGYGNFQTSLTEDSSLYMLPVLYGTYSAARNVGYPTFLLAVHNTVGLGRLAWIQFGAAVACYMGGAWLLAVRFANKWMGSIFAFAVVFQGGISEWAPQIMTEALFMAGLGLFAAALGALAWRPDRPAVIAAGVGIILVTLTKSVGIVLVLPALLLIRFLPKGNRLSVSGVIITCGLATYAVMAISNFVRTGIASPESFAGYALIGQVGWMLDDASMPPSDLTRSMISAAAPVIAERPAGLTNLDSIAALDRYVDFTSPKEYNVILWGNLVPIASAQLSSLPIVNSFFLRFALSSIREHPFWYFRHVAAHFYGMWRDLGRTASLRVATINIRRPQASAFRSTIPTSVLPPFPSEAALKDDIVRESNLPLMFPEVWSDDRTSSYWGVALGALAFFLCILVLVRGRLAYVYRTEIMIALSLNAYFGAHVLLQVSLNRYASVAVIAAIFLAASFVFTSSSMLAVLASTLLKGRAATRALARRWK